VLRGTYGTVQRDAPAVEAAGAHPHATYNGVLLARRSSAYEDLIALGGIDEAKAKGKLRLEGQGTIL